MATLVCDVENVLRQPVKDGVVRISSAGVTYEGSHVVVPEFRESALVNGSVTFLNVSSGPLVVQVFWDLNRTATMRVVVPEVDRVSLGELLLARHDSEPVVVARVVDNARRASEAAAEALAAAARAGSGATSAAESATSAGFSATEASRVAQQVSASVSEAAASAAAAGRSAEDAAGSVTEASALVKRAEVAAGKAESEAAGAGVSATAAAGDAARAKASADSAAGVLATTVAEASDRLQAAVASDAGAAKQAATDASRSAGAAESSRLAAQTHAKEAEGFANAARIGIPDGSVEKTMLAPSLVAEIDSKGVLSPGSISRDLLDSGVVSELDSKASKADLDKLDQYVPSTDVDVQATGGKVVRRTPLGQVLLPDIIPAGLEAVSFKYFNQALGETLDALAKNVIAKAEAMVEASPDSVVRRTASGGVEVPTSTPEDNEAVSGYYLRRFVAENSSGGSAVWVGTRAQYDAIASKDPQGLYVITGA